jgi:hypothetical protein
MRINVDPSTEAGGFGYAVAGRYRLRIAKAEHKQKQFPYIKWTIDFADPNVQSADPLYKKVGSIFENTTLKSGENAQFRLRQLCDAVGITWGDFDTDDAIGREFDAEVGISEYQGTMSNEIKKYVPMVK